MSKKIILLSCTALFVFLFLGLSEAVNVRKLGDPKTAFYSPDLKNQDDLRKMLEIRRDAIRQVVAQVGWRGNVEDLIRALDTGTFGESTLSTGAELPFMAYRKGGKPGAMRAVTYVGPPVQVYYIDFESGGTGWRFYAPKICSNFWLEERAIEKPAPPPPAPEPPPPPPPPAPEPAPAPEPEPPPPPEVAVEAPGLFFIAGLVGKERRVEVDQGILDADCKTLVGVKGGILPRLGDNAEAELSVGGKFVVGGDDDDDNGVDDDSSDSENDHSIFVDAAIHGLFSGGFFGGGVSFWDLTNDKLRTISLLLQFGVGSDTIQFTVEGRAPFEEFDDIENNYMVWGGIRIRP